MSARAGYTKAQQDGWAYADRAAQKQKEARAKMERDQETQNMLMFLAALLDKAGGQITLHEDELQAVADRVMIFDFDTLPGFCAVTLIPEFVQIGHEPAPAPRAFDDKTIADMLKEIEERQPRKRSGKDNAIYIQNPDGSISQKIATKTEWTISRDDTNFR